MQNPKNLDKFKQPLIFVNPGTFYPLNEWITYDGNKPAIGVYVSSDKKTKYIIPSQLSVPESVFEQSRGGAKYNVMCYSFICDKPANPNPEPTYEFIEKKPSGMDETLIVMIKDRNGYVKEDEYIAFFKPYFEKSISQIKTDPENPVGDFVNSFTGKDYFPVIAVRNNKGSPDFGEIYRSRRKEFNPKMNLTLTEPGSLFEQKPLYEVPDYMKVSPNNIPPNAVKIIDSQRKPGLSSILIQKKNGVPYEYQVSGLKHYPSPPGTDPQTRLRYEVLKSDDLLSDSEEHPITSSLRRESRYGLLKQDSKLRALAASGNKVPVNYVADERRSFACDSSESDKSVKFTKNNSNKVYERFTPNTKRNILNTTFSSDIESNDTQNKGSSAKTDSHNVNGQFVPKKLL